MDNIKTSTDVKNIMEKKGFKKIMTLVLSMAVVVMVVSGVSGLVQTNAVTIEQRQSHLLEQIRLTALEICEQDKAILSDQVEGGKDLNLDVSKHSTVMKNLEKAENCYAHVAQILSGDKVLGKY